MRSMVPRVPLRYLRGGYAVTRRLREGYADHTFAYAEAQVSQKAQLIFASYHLVI